MDPKRVFTGEIGVHRRRAPVALVDGWRDDEYDRFNPEGDASTRRNYGGSCYLSGLPDQIPSEYAWQVGGYYRDVAVSGGSPLDPRRPADRPRGS